MHTHHLALVTLHPHAHNSSCFCSVPCGRQPAGFFRDKPPSSDSCRLSQDPCPTPSPFLSPQGPILPVLLPSSRCTGQGPPIPAGTEVMPGCAQLLGRRPTVCKELGEQPPSHSCENTGGASRRVCPRWGGTDPQASPSLTPPVDAESQGMVPPPTLDCEHPTHGEFGPCEMTRGRSLRFGNRLTPGGKEGSEASSRLVHLFISGG